MLFNQSNKTITSIQALKNSFLMRIQVIDYQEKQSYSYISKCIEIPDKFKLSEEAYNIIFKEDDMQETKEHYLASLEGYVKNHIHPLIVKFQPYQIESILVVFNLAGQTILYENNSKFSD